MSQKASYFKIGILVIGAIVILVAAIIFLASGGLGEQPIYIETYFDESVQGLSAGSPVTYRGVQVGNVEKVTFTRLVYDLDPKSEAYHKQGRYVYVLIDLHPMIEGSIDQRSAKEVIQGMVEDGLRFQMKPQGITGLVALQAEYFDAEKNPPLEVPWDPKYPYLPSTPSFFTKIGDTMTQLGERINKLDIEGVIADMQQFLTSANQAFVDADIGGISKEAQGLVSELRATNQDVQKLLTGPEITQIAKDLAASVAGVRKIVESTESPMTDGLASFESSMANVDEITGKIDQFLGEREEKGGALQELTEALDGIRTAVDKLPAAIEDIDLVIRNANQTLDNQRRQFTQMLTTLEAVLRNIESLTEDAKRNPSRTLFGEPPPRSEIEER